MTEQSEIKMETVDVNDITRKNEEDIYNIVKCGDTTTLKNYVKRFGTIDFSPYRAMVYARRYKKLFILYYLNRLMKPIKREISRIESTNDSGDHIEQVIHDMITSNLADGINSKRAMLQLYFLPLKDVKKYIEESVYPIPTMETSGYNPEMTRYTAFIYSNLRENNDTYHNTDRWTLIVIMDMINMYGLNRSDNWDKFFI